MLSSKALQIDYMTDSETSRFLPAFILTFMLRLRFPPQKSVVTILEGNEGKTVCFEYASHSLDLNS